MAYQSPAIKIKMEKNSLKQQLKVKSYSNLIHMN